MNKLKDTNMTKLELLTDNLIIENPNIVKEIRSVSKLLGIELGWHYILDIIWLLKKINNFEKSMTILDAGAGMGLIQYILALRGYDVVSLDYNKRTVPKFVSQIFDVNIKDEKEFSTKYISQMSRNKSKKKKKSFPILIKNYTKAIFRRVTAINYIRRKSSHGQITFIREDMTDMRLLEENSVDIIVSVSAIEHVELDKINQLKNEFLRVCKNPEQIFVTTSGSATDKTWFHQPSKGLCFSMDYLHEEFGVKEKIPMDQVAEAYKSIIDCKYLSENLANFYFKSDLNGMPLGKWDPKYFPIGINF